MMLGCMHALLLATANTKGVGANTDVNSRTVLPVEILKSAGRGELQEVVKWLRKGRLADALCSVPNGDGQPSTFGLLHTAAANDLEMVKVLLKRGASVGLQSGLGVTALMDAAHYGHLPILLVLLQHSANPDLQSNDGSTALMCAAYGGQDACVQALLRAKANTELLDDRSFTALQCAEVGGHTAIAKLIQQHAAPLQPATAVVPEAEQAEQAEQAARADAAMEELLAEEAAEQAKAHAPSKKSKKKKKAGRAAAASDESSEVPPPAAPAPPPAVAPKPAASAAERVEAALRAAIAGGGLSALEAALAAAPREVREGGVGVEARAQCHKLLGAQQEAERKAKQEAAAEAARPEAAKQVQEVAAREAMRVAAASKARGMAVAAAVALVAATEAAAAAEAEADTLERATADGGEGGGSGAAGSRSEASEAVVPDQYVCSITAEIMTDPVCTVRAFHCPRGLFCISHTLLSRPHHPIFCGLPSLSRQADGHTYERSAIELWLETHDTSPATGVELQSKQLNPNHSLRSLIQDSSTSRAHSATNEIPIVRRSSGAQEVCGAAGAAGGGEACFGAQCLERARPCVRCLRGGRSCGA